MNEDNRSDAAAPAAASATKPLGDVIAINESLLKDPLDKIVVTTVEETLNALLDAEAGQLCGAQRYEHSASRGDTRAGHYERQLHTKAGEVTLKVPEGAEPAVRDGDHRALSAPRDQRRRGAGGDVSGRRVRAPRRGHHPGAVGHARQPEPR